MTEIKNDELNTVDEQKAESPKKDIRWYVIHTYSGYENKVLDTLKIARVFMQKAALLAIQVLLN